MRVFSILFIVIFSFHGLEGQSIGDIAHPLDIPPALSGSFGELRTDNFHAGIDFRTQGVTGHNIYSIADGYISRIRIQTGGYGKALYIDHPGGFTSVYGHLENFNEAIDSLVKDYQYSRQTHSMEIFPEKGRFPVKKGEFIAFSGNTGSSGGPHLHFEIRETNGQFPLNALLLNDFKLVDNSPPSLYTLAVYPIDPDGQVNGGIKPVYLPLESAGNGRFRIQGNSKIRIAGNASLGIEAYDIIGSNSLRCGVYSIELKIQEKTVYLFQVDKLNFSETRFLNAHIDYPRFISHKKRINRLYRKPNNRSPLYKVMVNDGIINVNESDTLNASVIVKDVAGNQSVLNFIIEGTAFNSSVKRVIPEPLAFFNWQTSNRYAGSYSELIIPQGALYESTPFYYSIEGRENSIYPYIHAVNDSLTPLHRAATLRLNGEMVPIAFRDKAVITKLSGNGQKTSMGGKWESNWLAANISSFGRYSMEIDTIPPVIKPINISPGRNMGNSPSIRFTIEDNLTGISEYKGFINNEWVLFEYDPKNKHLFYTFDKKRLQRGSNHELEVYIVDGTGNKSMYHTRFVW